LGQAATGVVGTTRRNLAALGSAQKEEEEEEDDEADKEAEVGATVELPVPVMAQKWSQARLVGREVGRCGNAWFLRSMERYK